MKFTHLIILKNVLLISLNEKIGEVFMLDLMYQMIYTNYNETE
ncbi:hypothetical protein BN000_05102 [Neobacillus massiliamazoniensis]|uniref:Uncharacterized protein n=1 Tax=Neobacillus massiliamazoniensis TaxID=1499688 RepID=A0A0U1P4M6_9BACI|nr:hypothetical protein BN000_05102 [Neobacillus massiliamazoniensis]